MGEVITLPVIRVEREPAAGGNGAREALIDIGKDCPFHVPADIAACWADDVLVALWSQGFKVVPVDGSEK